MNDKREQRIANANRKIALAQAMISHAIDYETRSLQVKEYTKWQRNQLLRMACTERKKARRLMDEAKALMG